MSATGRSDVRRKDDFYATPGWCVDVLLRELRPDPRCVVCEPTAGTGSIVRRLLNYGFTNVHAMEIDQTRASRLFELPISVRVGDARAIRPRCVPDLTVGNPPFWCAQQIIEGCLAWTRGITAMLLRTNFVGPECRCDFLEANKPDIWILDRRPSFCSNVHWEIGWYDGPKKAKNWNRVAGPFFIEDTAKAELAAELARTINGHPLTLRRKRVSNDSCEYAWMLFGLPGGGGRWRLLRTRDKSMKDKLDISRQLPIPAAHMPNYAQYMATQLQNELGITWSWKSNNCIEFKAESGVAKGVNGTLSFEDSTIRLMVNLPFMLAAMAPSIEKTIEGRLAELVGMATRPTT